MKTDAQIDEELHHVEDMIQALLSVHNMILSADDQSCLVLEHHETGTGILKVRKIEIGTCISY